MDIEPQDVEKIWNKLAKVFRNWNGMKPRWAWFKTGLSERASCNRVRILEGGEQAKTYFSLTKSLSAQQLNYLQVRAQVNLEQAQAAARWATILNLTIFMGVLLIFNQLFPGLIAQKVSELLQSGDIGLIALVVATVIWILLTIIIVLSYSQGGTSQARDLKHLLELSLARRALRASQSNSEDAADIRSDLRENFITDI